MSANLNKIVYEIESEQQFFEIKEQIDALDQIINIAYNYLPTETNFESIVATQDWIDRLKRKRNGLFNLTILYTTKNNQKNDVREYTCKFGDTLLIIAQAVYGVKEYWQHLYLYNELTTDVLELNQRIKLPVINQSNELALGKNFIEILEGF